MSVCLSGHIGFTPTMSPSAAPTAIPTAPPTPLPPELDCASFCTFLSQTPTDIFAGRLVGYVVGIPQLFRVKFALKGATRATSMGDPRNVLSIRDEATNSVLLSISMIHLTNRITATYNDAVVFNSFAVPTYAYGNGWTFITVQLAMGSLLVTTSGEGWSGVLSVPLIAQTSGKTYKVYTSSPSASSSLGWIRDIQIYGKNQVSISDWCLRQ